MTTLSDAFEWELALENKGYESGSESLNILTPLWRTPHLYHVSASESLSFDPATPLTTVHSHWAHSTQWHRSHSSVCQHLMFSNDKSPTPDSTSLSRRAELSSPAQQHMVHHHAPMPGTDDPLQDVTAEEEDFSPQPHWMMTFGLKIQFWIDICVFMKSHSHTSCVPVWGSRSFILYSLDLPPPPTEDTPASYYETMDLGDISDLQDVMTMTRDEDIPDLDDVFGLWTWTMV